MKTCRLKIITANIIGDTATPEIHYVSQTKKPKQEIIPISPNNTENKIINKLEENNLVKEEHIEKKPEEKEEKEENEKKMVLEENTNGNENKIDNKILEEKNFGENGVKDPSIEPNIDENDLWTISNQKLYEIQNINNEVDNNSNNYNVYNQLKNNYPYSILNKKKDLNNSLRYLFKNRETKYYNKNQNILKNSNKSLSISKDTNIRNRKSTKNNKSKISLNQTQTSNKPINSKSSASLTLKNKNLNKSINNKSKNTNNNNNKILRSNKKNENIIGENISSVASWKIIEKNDYNIGQIIDYKALIDDLMIKECKLVKEKEDCIQLFEKKLKPLRELNQKLVDENNEELNRADELNGELILLKSQYEKLFNTLYSKNSKNISVNNKINLILDDPDFNRKQKEIDNEMKILNDKLKNGEFILITKPANHQALTTEEDKILTYFLRGMFFSLHILDTDKIIDIIWKFDREFQTIYFLVEELLNFYNYDTKTDRNILINYIYSFCKNFSYMNITDFKAEFKKKIGKIQIPNKYVYMSKLLHFHKTKLKILLKLVKKKDIFNRGVINFNQFHILLYDCGITFNTLDKSFDEVLEFLIYCMKKEHKLDIFEKKEELKDPNEKEIKNSVYDLYYESLQDFIDEYYYNNISNPYHLIKLYMTENDIISVEKILRPILIPKYLIKINSKDYIDNIILNKYLRIKGIIKKDDKILVDTFEEDLVDINKFIDDIYERGIEEDKQKLDYEELKNKAENLIDEIFKLNY